MLFPDGWAPSCRGREKNKKSLRLFEMVVAKKTSGEGKID